MFHDFLKNNKKSIRNKKVPVCAFEIWTLIRAQKQAIFDIKNQVKIPVINLNTNRNNKY